MKPNLSEFSYGYALTEELVRSLGPLAAAPQFPSLKDEGKLGYDLELSTPLLGSLFLQFKLSDRMKSNKAREIRDNLFPVDSEFFRMHLRLQAGSEQHGLLLKLALKGEQVFYATPEFDTCSDLDDAYRATSVAQRSAFFSPREIGDLEDAPHHVAFRKGEATAWVCSRPREIHRHRVSRESVMPMEARRAQTIRAESERLVEAMSQILGAKARDFAARVEGPGFGLRGERPDQFAAYLASTYFGARLVLVGREESP